MQAPAHAVSASSFSPQALGVTLQLTNVLLLLAGLAVGVLLAMGAAGG